MKYEKPMIQVISAAAKAIESTELKFSSTLPDHINGSMQNTGPAYEADE